MGVFFLKKFIICHPKKIHYTHIMKPTTVQGYIDQLPVDRKEAFLQLRQTILKHLPE